MAQPTETIYSEFFIRMFEFLLHSSCKYSDVILNDFKKKLEKVLTVLECIPCILKSFLKFFETLLNMQYNFCDLV